MGARSTGSHPTTTKADGHLLEYFRQNFGVGGGANSGPSIEPSGLSASGGIVNDYTEPGGSIYRAHIFTSSGTFQVTQSGTFGNDVDFLVVAGGGGGGRLAASGNGGRGGGGAGGLRSNHPDVPSPMRIGDSSLAYPGSGTYNYTVTVGAGGAKRDAPAPGSYQTTGFPGGNSSVTGPNHPGSGGAGGVVASGGGGGTTLPGVAAATGGSGGGGAYGSNAAATVSATDGISPDVQGSPGSGGDGRGGGGGGAGGPAPSPGNGGDGLVVCIAEPPATPTGNRMFGDAGAFAGGGGGGGGYGGSTGGTGGPGGGGGGSDLSGNNAPAEDGDYSTGGGGGGGSGAPGSAGNFSAGNGGSGIVVLRYKIAELTATAKATGGAISFYNGKTIHTFASSGTFATTSDWSAATVEYVVIGGGGAGSSFGGGGAGAYRTGTTPIGAHPVSTSIQIGAGGAPTKGELSPSIPTSDYSGNPSYFGTPITAPGGGGGGHDGNNGGPGGSGGGGSGVSPPTAGPGTGDNFPGTIGATPTSGWGHDGGTGTYSATYTGAGGGGAGGAGANGVDSTNSGSGGAGIQLPTTFRDPASGVGGPGPTSAPTPNGFDTSGKYWVAGGGSGAIGPRNSPHNFAPSYVGGGGGAPMANGERNSFAGAGIGGYTNGPPGSTTTTLTGQNAGENTGSGGGGGLWANNAVSRPSGAGGSGLVLIAYPT